jgi:hypothetical protein
MYPHASPRHAAAAALESDEEFFDADPLLDALQRSLCPGASLATPQRAPPPPPLSPPPYAVDAPLVAASLSPLSPASPNLVLRRQQSGEPAMAAASPAASSAASTVDASVLKLMRLVAHQQRVVEHQADALRDERRRREELEVVVADLARRLDGGAVAQTAARRPQHGAVPHTVGYAPMMIDESVLSSPNTSAVLRGY